MKHSVARQPWDLAYCRYLLHGGITAIVWRDSQGKWRSGKETCQMIEDAMECSDRFLIEENDVVFLTDDQFEKLLVLL